MQEVQLVEATSLPKKSAPAAAVAVSVSGRDETSLGKRSSTHVAALWSCGQALIIAAVVMGVLLASCYVTAKLLYDAVPEARQASANISSHLDLGHIQRGLGAMKTYVREAHWLSVLFFSLVFTIKTTFSIPGATPLCVIAGALFPWGEAVVLCTILVIMGSFFSYNISKYLLSPEVLEYIASKDRVDQFRAQVELARKENRLFWALLALRLFPLTPGSVINTFSPHVNVPVGVFAVTILGGNMPYILITTAAGDSLASIKDLGDIVSPRIMIEFTLLAVISCVPVILKRRAKAAADLVAESSASHVQPNYDDAVGHEAVPLVSSPENDGHEADTHLHYETDFTDEALTDVSEVSITVSPPLQGRGSAGRAAAF